MTEREMLEFAAKAAGYGDVWYLGGGSTPYVGKRYEIGEPISYRTFQPLTDDGDALRLAVKLELTEVWFDKSTGRPEVVCGKHGTGICVEPLRDDPCAATRRAIVRAAAEIGKAMP